MNDIVERIYVKFRKTIGGANSKINPYLRRVLRFMALPYCYIYLVNWEICTVSRLQVISDLLYIFFRLKYYPDNYNSCRLWELDREEWQYYYGSIYNPYTRSKLRKRIQPAEYIIIFDDKEICYDLCKSGNLPVPDLHASIEPQDDHERIIKDILSKGQSDNLFLKPTRGKGGAEIYNIQKVNEIITVRWSDSKNRMHTGNLKDIKITRRSIVQKAIVQHEKMAAFSQSSVNTIRLVTFLTEEKSVVIVGAFLRLSTNDSCVDNTNKGGIGVGIDTESGRLREVAFDQRGNKFIKHPTSGIWFKDYQIPYWDRLCRLAKNTQQYFFYYKLLGIDMAIQDEEPVIIEINHSYDNVGLEQKCGGIFKNQTIYQQFKENDILIRTINPYE